MPKPFGERPVSLTRSATSRSPRRGPHQAVLRRVARPNRNAQPRFLICVRNDGYAASLEPRKVYEVIPDEVAEARHHVRVVDKSGEDYLYSEDFFVPIELPREAVRAFARAS